MYDDEIMLWKHKNIQVCGTLFAHENILQDSIRSRGSSGSIVPDYGLDDQGSIPDKGREFFF
jgi:hypothetical protein